MTLTICKTCDYPHKGKSCNNPACNANPRISEVTKAVWREEQDKRNRQEADRANIRRIRSNYR